MIRRETVMSLGYPRGSWKEGLSFLTYIKTLLHKMLVKEAENER